MSLTITAQKLYFRRTWHQASRRTSGQQFSDGTTAFLAIVERPLIHVHTHKLVGKDGIHIAGKLHGVIEGRLAMIEGVFNAFADHPSHLPAHVRAQRTTYGICAERQRKTGGFPPPMP